jgi:hypothetical protein
MLPGFNRGNLDWFHAYALKRRIYLEQAAQPGDPRERAMSPWEPSREALWKFPQAARERSPAAIIPSKWEASWESCELAFTPG